MTWGQFDNIISEKIVKCLTVCVAILSYILNPICKKHVHCIPAFYLSFLKKHHMKTAELPKFQWDRVETNAGHTKDEWRKQEYKPKNNIIEAYDLSWNVNKKKNDDSNGQTLLEELLSNASYVYVENDHLG